MGGSWTWTVVNPFSATRYPETKIQKSNIKVHFLFAYTLLPSGIEVIFYIYGNRIGKKYKFLLAYKMVIILNIFVHKVGTQMLNLNNNKHKRNCPVL